jgi:hypothetical protein
MKLNAARIKALLAAALAFVASDLSAHPEVVGLMPKWAGAVVSAFLTLYAARNISSTAFKTGGSGATVPPANVLVLLAIALALPACPAGCPTTPTDVGAKIAHCGKQDVANAITFMPEVNACLMNSASVSDALVCLGGIAAKIGEETVVCLVSQSGSEYGDAFKRTGNQDFARAQTNADGYLHDRGWTVTNSAE